MGEDIASRRKGRDDLDSPLVACGAALPRGGVEKFFDIDSYCDYGNNNGSSQGEHGYSFDNDHSCGIDGRDISKATSDRKREYQDN
ncbi:MAG: hypothetical protein ACKPKO_43460 [Candidatus Fonsibacter sp.]